MQQKQLAEFHGVTDRAVRKWSDEKTKRKTIQAEADVTPDEWRLIGEIMQLAYLYNAKGWVGDKPVKWCSVMMNSLQLMVAFYDAGQSRRDAFVTFTDTNASAQMDLLKRQLEQLVY